jgi:hypothetical protein
MALQAVAEHHELPFIAHCCTLLCRSKSPGAYQAGKSFAASLQDSLFSGQPFTTALQQQLQQQLQVQVYNHTFTVQDSGFSTSSSSSSSSSAGRTCTNVHAVLSSRRGDGKEALLLATPINHQAFSTGGQCSTCCVVCATATAGNCHPSRAAWYARACICKHGTRRALHGCQGCI